MEACSETAGEFLLRRPWLPVCIGDGQLLAKAWFGDIAYHLLLTDMRCVWEERMDSTAIQKRAQELNKRLRAPVAAFYSHLREVALPCLSALGGGRAEGEAQVSLTRGGVGDGVSIRLKSELAGLPFHWEFHCTPPPADAVCTQLVRPLLAMSLLLQTQVDQLGALLARKDAEIQDYKENGATLSRARLETEVFDEQAYRDNIVAQVLPQLISDQREGLGFSSDLRELYSTVVAHGNHGKRKRAPSEDRSDVDSPLAAEGQEAENATSPAPTPGDGEAARGEVTPPVQEEQGANQEQAGSKTAEQQTLRSSGARPKKKKAVGLFR